MGAGVILIHVLDFPNRFANHESRVLAKWDDQCKPWDRFPSLKEHKRRHAVCTNSPRKPMKRRGAMPNE